MPAIHKVFAFLKKDLAETHPIAHSAHHILYPATMKAQEWAVGTLGGKNDKRNTIERGPNSEFNYDPADNSIPVHRPKPNAVEPEPRALTTADVREFIIEHAGIRKDTSTTALLTANVPAVSPIIKKLERIQYTTEL